jgi:hypothetical protein
MARCDCAQTMYRNEANGKRSYKVKGKTGCIKCQGYGYTLKCETCDGCGMAAGVKCTACWGCGQVPDRRTQQ